MQYINQLADDDRARCLRVLTAVGSIRSHRGLLDWLRSNDMQQLLPHDMLVAVWGAVRSETAQFDVVSALPGVRTSSANADSLLSVAQPLYMQWLADQQPCAVDARQLDGIFAGTSLAGHAAWACGLRDQRADQDAFYILVSGPAHQPQATADALVALLPHIDAGFRQVTPLPPRAARPMATPYHDQPASVHRMPAEQIRLPQATHLLNTMGMSERELQIMRWVEMGKTNQEIGTILDISAFTVKNHLQRIFKKLDVYSRAQAVSRFKDSMLHG